MNKYIMYVLLFFRSLCCIDLFKLSPELNREVASILISSEKLDKDLKIDVSFCICNSNALFYYRLYVNFIQALLFFFVFLF